MGKKRVKLQIKCWLKCLFSIVFFSSSTTLALSWCGASLADLPSARPDSVASSGPEFDGHATPTGERMFPLSAPVPATKPLIESVAERGFHFDRAFWTHTTFRTLLTGSVDEVSRMEYEMVVHYLPPGAKVSPRNLKVGEEVLELLLALETSDHDLKSKKSGSWELAKSKKHWTNLSRIPSLQANQSLPLGIRQYLLSKTPSHEDYNFVTAGLMHHFIEKLESAYLD